MSQPAATAVRYRWANQMWVIPLIPVGAGLLLYLVGFFMIGASALSDWRSLTVGERSRLLVKLTGLAIFVATILNGFAFSSMSIYFGGSAHGGKVENGHHYVVSHGRFTEVTESVFAYLRIHETVSFWIGIPLGLVSIAIVLIVRYCENRLTFSVIEVVDVKAAQQ
jgi:hypothetical protein